MRLVIADDDRWVLRMLRTALTYPNIEIVGEAPDGASALLTVAETRPDVLVTDIRMPYLDGISLTSYVTKAYENLTVIGFTGDEQVEPLLSAGAAQVILKPHVEDLVDAVVDLVEAPPPRVKGSFG